MLVYQRVSLAVVGPAALRESWRCHIRGGHPNPPSFVSHSDLQGLVSIGDGQMIWLISWVQHVGWVPTSRRWNNVGLKWARG